MQHNQRNWLLWLLPTPGNIIFTLLIISGILWAQSAGAITLGVINAPTNTNILIPYQGRLTDPDGNPLSGAHTVAFSLYTEVTGGEPVWSEGRFGPQRVNIVDGLFNVMLGDVNPLPQSTITNNSTLYLGITIDPHEEMSPRVQLGAVPYAVHALNVPDGSITQEKLSSDVRVEPPDGSVTAAKLADGSVTQTKLSNEINLAIIQSGRVARNINHSGWILHQGSGEREYTVDITFAKNFEHIPNVVVGLAHTDVANHTNNRLTVYETNVTKNGFQLVFRTWHTTQVTGATAIWIAHTSP